MPFMADMKRAIRADVIALKFSGVGGGGGCYGDVALHLYNDSCDRGLFARAVLQKMYHPRFLLFYLEFLEICVFIGTIERNTNTLNWAISQNSTVINCPVFNCPNEIIKRPALNSFRDIYCKTMLLMNFCEQIVILNHLFSFSQVK